MKVFMLLFLTIQIGIGAAFGHIPLVENGKTDAVIVVGEAPSRQAREAAEELRAYLYQISGANIPVVDNEPAAKRGIRIFVGVNAAASKAQEMGLRIPTGISSELNEEGYVVAAQGDTILLAGNETGPYQGAYYAVYDFLESMGCRWYFPGAFGEIIPRTATLEVNSIKKVVKPEFRVRDIWYSGFSLQSDEQQAEFLEWKRRNKFCRRDFWYNGTMPEAVYGQNPVDDSTYKLLPKEKYWDTHPEYYSLNEDGTRNERFLCVSSEGAFLAAVDTVIAFFREHPEYYSFSFSPPDAPVLCYCRDCQHAMHGGYGGEGYGEVSDPWFGFVFRLAEEVEKVYPEKWIITMAYFNRCRPPEGVYGKHRNVLIQFAPMMECTLHSYMDDHCLSRQGFASMLKHWSELTSGIVYYEYDPHEWTQIQRPVWRSQGIAEDYRFLKELGGWGFSDEGQMAWASTGLNYYLRGRLAWDTSINPTEIIRDFCERFFGPAHEEMFRCYTAVEERLGKSNLHLTMRSISGHDRGVQILGEDIGEWRVLLDEARQKASQEPYASRVRIFAAQLDRMRAYLNSRRAAGRGGYNTAIIWAEKMIEAVEAAGNSLMLQDFGRYGNALSSREIIKRLSVVKPFTDGTRGSLIRALPEYALFRTDLASEGVVGRWYKMDTDMKDWQNISMETGWGNSGVTAAGQKVYEGLAWYRIKFELGEVPAGDEMLFLPELAGSEYWLWCNETFVKYSKINRDTLTELDHFEKSCRIADLKGRLKKGANVITVRIKGDDGIAQVPFIFRPAGEN